MAIPSIGVQDKYQYSVLINGNPITLNINNDVYAVIVNENIRQKVPVLKLSVLDYQGIYSSTSPINDGTRIEVAINDGSSGLANYSKFRSFGTPKRRNSISGYSELEVIGLLDTQDYLYQTANTSFKGSSTGVVNNIASVLNMKYATNDNSNDSMTWLPYKKLWSDFVKYISKHSWTDDKSVFSVGVTADGTLNFYNVQKLFENRKPVLEFVRGVGLNPQSSVRQVMIINYQAVNRSGQFNFQGAYGMRTSQTDGSGNVSIYQQVNASKNANSSLDINKNVAARLQNRSKMHIAPVDCGNAHPNYIRARHQNKRLTLTYSQNLYVICYEYTSAKLYDMVTVYIAHEGKKDDTVSGIYMVSAVSRFIYGNNYYEKIELTTIGPSNPNAELY